MPIDFYIHYQLLLLALAALFLDALLGSHGLLGRIPGPDSLIRAVVGLVDDRLPPTSARSFPEALMGVVVTLSLMTIAWIAGAWFSRLIPDGRSGQVAHIFILALLLGQRSVLDTARHLAKRLEAPAAREAEGRYAAARWTIERLAHRFADGLVANLFWLAIGGLAGVLAFRVLSVMTAAGSATGVKRPQRPFFFLVGWTYWLCSLPAGLLSGLYIVIAGFVMLPARAIASMRFITHANPSNSIPIRVWPLRALSELLGVNVKVDPDTQDGTTEWLGAADGRARAGPEDVRKAMITILVAWMLVLLSLGALLLSRAG